MLKRVEFNVTDLIEQVIISLEAKLKAEHMWDGDSEQILWSATESWTCGGFDIHDDMPQYNRTTIDWMHENARYVIAKEMSNQLDQNITDLEYVVLEVCYDKLVDKY